ncbi:hypothetical protein ISN45_Aa02g011260 [Arabidopsis thaliana x Arabidopsis arenosa]|uniref:Uncharacterized protein n=1 Tax=Arabidopsis thaliana x Arabidopsis arenosa TaxID=1240361 RepID=A0A8T2BEK2_9BRAS|nr:hypothetical protein ISN45_Aa02g011260 [Arabidopsis thaliana x Arabidopsis arenosa]
MNLTYVNQSNRNPPPFPVSLFRNRRCSKPPVSKSFPIPTAAAPNSPNSMYQTVNDCSAHRTEHARRRKQRGVVSATETESIDGGRFDPIFRATHLLKFETFVLKNM